MRKLRSIARWGSLIAMVVGAAVSVGVAAFVSACSSDDDGKKSGSDSGTGDAGDAAAAEAGPDGSVDVTFSDAPQPTDDVSLDTFPAE